MQPDDMVVVDAQGSHVRGHRRVTSEFRMHLAIYRHRPDVAAVVHAHPPHATAFAMRRQPLPRGVLPEIEVFLGEIPLVPYARFGTETMGDVLRPCLGQHVAWLLASHGAVTAGTSPLEAYLRMESVDFYCRILTIAATLGGWRALAPHEVEELWNLRHHLGYPDVTQGMTAEQWIAGDSSRSTSPDA
jgi:L-fuculose-phosphate aldolase